MKIKKWLTMLTCLLPITAIKPPLLKMLGHRVGSNVKIGISLILVDKLFMCDSSKIGMGNVIRVCHLVLKNQAQIRNLNFISGNFDVWMDREAFIINLNIITRGGIASRWRRSKLRLGRRSQISSMSNIDLTETVWIGDDTVLAGKGIQIWTHGFIHFKDRSRHLVCGRVTFGKNVYVGARSCISAGISIADDVAIGAQSSVAKDLAEPGLYVSAPLRLISGSQEDRLEKFAKIDNNETRQSYYRKMRKK